MRAIERAESGHGCHNGDDEEEVLSSMILYLCRVVELQIFENGRTAARLRSTCVRVNQGRRQQF